MIDDPRYTLNINPQLAKETKRVPEHTLRKLKRTLQALQTDPRPKGATHLKGKLLCNRRCRIGDYRLIYHVNDDRRVLEILKFGHRRDIY